MKYSSRGTGAHPTSAPEETGLHKLVPRTLRGQERHVRQLFAVSLAAPCAWLAFGLLYLVAYDSVASFAAFAVITVLCLSAALVLRVTGSVDLGGNLLALVCLGGLVLVAVLRGGFPVTVLMWILLIPMSAMLVSPRLLYVVVWTVISIAVIITFYVLHELGLSSPGIVEISPGLAPTHAAFGLIVLLLFLVSIVRPAVRIQASLGRERDELSRRLEQSERLDALGQLTGGIAHDFRNILAGVQAAADLLEERIPADAPEREDIEVIQQCADRGTRLTRQLLTFARQAESKPELIDLNRAVAELSLMASRVLERVDVHTELAGNIGPVLIDPGQLDRILLNLALNARDAMPNGGRLTIRTAVAHIDAPDERYPGLAIAEWVKIEIEDTGKGMDETTLQRIFEPFFTTKTNGGGTGLGLATCYGIVANAGGEIFVESTPGKGTLFSIFLPAATASAFSARAKAAPPPSRGDARILVVDDEPHVVSTVARILSAHGYQVVTAGNGEEALSVLASDDDVDLVITDVVMPGLSGPELADRVPHQNASPAVTFMSAEPERAGGDPLGDVLAKPFTRAQLLSHIQLLLARGKSDTSERN